MCLLAISVDRKPSLQDLNKGWASNDDGAGLVWLGENRKVEYIKGIQTVEELHNLILATPLPFVFHMRLKSIGGVDPLLTHPFEITKDSELKLYNQCDRLLLQNGTDRDYDVYLDAAGIQEPLEKDGKTLQPMSDSRAIAMVLSRHKNYKFMERLGKKGKFVIAGFKNSKDDKWIRYYGDFTEDNGILYSNTIWKHKTQGAYHGTYYGCGGDDYEGFYNQKEVQAPAPEAKKKSHRQTYKYPNH